MSIVLISSPLQGFTDFRFRNTFQKHFGGIDYFYAPYIRLTGDKLIKPAYTRDILPENNSTITVQPQVMCKSADDFLLVAKHVQDLGYSELNWNLGCPYSMVTKRGMGAGLIKEADLVRSILEQVQAESSIDVSIKMRLGNESKDEILDLLSVLDDFKIKHIAIHPRIGKQMYKGSVDLKSFEACLSHTKHPVIYNGDIRSLSDFKSLETRFPMIQEWMIGRGLIADPFLPNMIQQNTSEYPANVNEIFREFHDELMFEYSQFLSGDKHLMIKMFSFWEYFSTIFSNSHKVLKKFKKANNMKAYNTAVAEVLRTEKIVGVEAL